MAEKQVVLQQQDIEHVQEETLVEETLALNRFIFLHNFKTTFLSIDDHHKKNCKIKVWSSKSSEICNHLKKMVEINALQPLIIIEKALNSKSLYSPNEALWCLAYCLCEFKNEVLRREIRKNFSEIITTSEQLLIFLYSYQLLRDCKLNFGRGMRTALAKWYAKKSTSELFDLIFSARKYETITHKKILHMIHLKLEDREKNKIIHSMYKKEDEKLETETSLDKMILRHRQIKHSLDVKKIIDILQAKEFTYKLHHIPTFAQKSHEVIDLIIPNMSLDEVIEKLIFFCSQKMLKVQNPISKKICNALQASSKEINEAKLHPLYVFNIIKELEKRLTIYQQETPNDAVIEDEKSKTKKFSNPYIIKKMQHIFNITLGEQPKTGCRYFVTVDFRQFSKRQSHVFGMRNILCSELQAIIALTLLKNEKEVTIMSFSEIDSKLKAVEWEKETSFEKALEIYETEINKQPKTKEVITLPIKKAIEDKKKIDVFVTFVSSLGRTMGKNGKSDFIYSELQNYRKTMNLKMTKYVIINMTQKEPTIQHTDKSKGLFEVIGFSLQAAKTLDSYARNSFA
ncbi:hypothetical protein PVAND_003557 [Polypedilum vanderplanki]|uniref:RNA-binding protein RO60 vWA domain-containing protein n=1 Tax=Polypedilum vanderplanki TaxID=319348 RepID=A0A9J6BVF8_POLVA|nr:hypothetical protein PVAND_003557 [Polypedilum vanderplanki]